MYICEQVSNRLHYVLDLKQNIKSMIVIDMYISVGGKTLTRGIKSGNLEVQSWWI